MMQTRTNRVAISLATFIFFSLLPQLAAAKGFNQKCPTHTGRMLVYGVGSSTMGSVLGPMLEVRLKRRKLAFRQWGKASSGLARPDFHDWPSKVRGVSKRFNPELFIVSLGTNDFQALWHKKRWYRFGTKKWREIYTNRVDDMLTKMVGPKKKRAVIWIGPIAFAGKLSVKRAPVVHAILKQRVEAFDGPVMYYDAFSLTSNRDGTPIRTYTDAKGKKKRARAKDGIHLSTQAVRTLIALPLTRLVDTCLGTSEPKKRKKQKKQKKKKKRKKSRKGAKS